MNVLILFLIYDPIKTQKVNEVLLDIINRCQSATFTLVEINNANIDRQWKCLEHKGGLYYSVGGDNSAQEFSGWDHGWRQAKKNLGQNFDLIFVVNDALLNSKNVNHTDVIDDSLLNILIKHRFAAGWVDTFARVHPDPVDTLSTPYKIFGVAIRKWLSSCLMIIPVEVFEEVFPLTRFTETGSVYNENFAQGLFHPDCGLSRGYQDFLIVHQSCVWVRNNKRGYIISEDTFDFFKMKTRNIINEHLIGVRLLQADCFFLSISALYAMKPGTKRAQIFLHKMGLGSILPRLVTTWQFIQETLKPAVTVRMIAMHHWLDTNISNR